jgi:hypothetical protein
MGQEINNGIRKKCVTVAYDQVSIFICSFYMACLMIISSIVIREEPLEERSDSESESR